MIIFVWICYEVGKNCGNVVWYIKVGFYKFLSMNYWVLIFINLGLLVVLILVSFFYLFIYLCLENWVFFFKKCFYVESIDGDWVFIEIRYLFNYELYI